MSTIFANTIMGRSTTYNMDLAIVQNFGPALIPASTVVQFVGPVRQGRGPGTFGFIETEPGQQRQAGDRLVAQRVMDRIFSGKTAD